MRGLVTMDNGLTATLVMTFDDDPDDSDVTIKGDAGLFVDALLDDGVSFGHDHYSPVNGITIVDRRSVNWIMAELDRSMRFGEGVDRVTVVDAKDMPTYELPDGAEG